ncbi:MAG: MFS transporter [Burkholderiales bacterium]|nr:MFS transporter [Burkholderiales bacterium]
MSEPATPPGMASSWAPLRRPAFRSLWIATVASNVGTWMHEVGAGWLMVTLGAGPAMVALVQAAGTLPVFLLALPAGAFADIVDRRRILIATQVWMLACAASLGALTLAGAIGGWSLLAATFALNCGTAMMIPAWAAVVQELVPREELQSAVALNSVGVNVARAVGPAVAGVLVGAAGPAAAFFLNAVSFLGVVIVLTRWRREPRHGTLPAERFLGAMRAGLRYVREAPALKSVMARAAAFSLFAAATWALLPLVARAAGGGARTYGLLLALIGAGAVGGAFVLPRLRAKCSRDRLVRAATCAFAAAMLAVAVGHALAVLVPAMVVTGLAWITALSTLHVAAQTAVPAWVRARGLSIYLVTFSAGFAGGSILWGALAQRWGVTAALAMAAAGAMLTLAATRGYSLGGQEGADETAPVGWREPATAVEVEPDRGPVLVTVEYRIAPADGPAFTAAMGEVRRVRLRDGATSWGLFEDAARPGRYLESFLVESWVEHLRQHRRATVADRDVSERARRFHVGPVPPHVTHLIAAHADGIDPP